MQPLIAVTSGEPAGIGQELCLRLAGPQADARVVVLGDRTLLAERAGQPVPVTVAQLLELELAGWIAAVPGGYVRLRRACHVRRTDVFV